MHSIYAYITIYQYYCIHKKYNCYNPRPCFAGEGSQNTYKYMYNVHECSCTLCSSVTYILVEDSGTGSSQRSCPVMPQWQGVWYSAGRPHTDGSPWSWTADTTPSTHTSYSLWRTHYTYNIVLWWIPLLRTLSTLCIIHVAHKYYYSVVSIQFIWPYVAVPVHVLIILMHLHNLKLHCIMVSLGIINYSSVLLF